MKAFVYSGNYGILSLGERAGIEVAEAEKKVEEQIQYQAEADVRQLYMGVLGALVRAK